MEKSKIPLSQIAVGAILLLLAGAGVYFLVFADHQGASSTDPHLADSAKVTPIQQDSAPVVPPPPPRPQTTSTTKRVKAVVRDTVKKLDTAKPPPKNEIIQRVEEKVRLKKPQTPSQVPEYLPLVYWACRQIGPIDPDRALEWVGEGLYFKEDAAFFAYGALLHLRKGRRAQAQVFAEAGMRGSSYLDPKAVNLSNAILASLRDTADPAAKAIVRSYP